MLSTIPASAIVTVNPGVISAGGDALSLNGLMLTTSVRPPIGEVLSIPTLAGVIDYFGADSLEANIAAVYFAGFDNSQIKPNNLLFAQYPESAVAGWVRGGNVGGYTLTQLQALSGVLTMNIDGTPYTSSAIDLSAATSFTNAAQRINRALGVTGETAATFTGSIAGTVLTVSATGSGLIEVGQVLSGTGITAGTYITGLGTGLGGLGTYTVSDSQSASSTAITAKTPVVTYDNIATAFLVTSPTTGVDADVGFATGTISAGLKLTEATGAIDSGGAAATTPAAFMNSIVTLSQDWASFTTLFEPSKDDKEAFAGWNATQNNRWLYAMWETSAAAATADPSSTAGATIVADEDSGTAMIWQPEDYYTQAFVMGAIASIDFTQTEGRANLAFRQQSGLTPGVRDQTTAAQLIANGYSYYGAYATATTGDNFFYPGQVVGPFAWIDTYVNQIWLNTELQAALLQLLLNVRSVPYNDAGYNLIRQACADPINAALNFGAIREGVPLSASQAAQVNAAAGIKIDGVLATAGWYLQVKPATAPQRAARSSPPMTLWYMDGQSVQSVNLASIVIQ